MVFKWNPIWAALLLAMVVSSCGGGGGGTSIPDPTAATQIILPSGGGAVFPAGSFANATEVKVTEELTGAQSGAAGFPAGSGALLGATTIEVPAGVALATDITVRIALTPAQATNLSFTVYNFNSGTGMWETAAGVSSLKNTAATADVSGGSYVMFTADTSGTTGLMATYGVFENLYVTIPGGGGTTDPNLIPAVTLTASAATVDPTVVVNLTATGTDADGDTLTFSWLAPGGTLGTPATTGGTSTATWSAAAGGTYVVSVSVNDGNGGVDTDAVTITVTTPGVVVENNAPVVGELKKNVAMVYTTQEVHLSTTATDADGDALTITWAGPGTFSHQEFDAETGAATATWIGDAAGSTELTVTADDGVTATSDTASSSLTFDVTALPTDFEWVGYTSCADACHSSFSNVTQAGWLATNHATAWERNLLTSDHLSASCYNCHGVGIEPAGEGGFISYDTTPQFANIQCESCHGTGKGHPAGGALPVPWNPGTGYAKDAEGNYVVVDDVYQYDEEYDGAQGYGCGLCHEGLRHGAFEEWAESGHANFVLEEEGEVPGEMVPDHYLTGSSCNPCHSGMQFATIRSGQEPLDLSGLTIDDPLDDHLIGCATCHDPHSNQYEAQLRVDSTGEIEIPFSDTDNVPTMVMGGRGNTCIACHNGRRDRGDYDDQITSGSGHFGPHGNPQGAMLFGLMGADLGVTPAVVDYATEHPHVSWNEDTCVTCHMYNRPYISSSEPHLWGHNFEARFERCVECHGNFSDEAEFWLWVEEFQAEIDVLLQDFVDVWPAAWKDGEGLPVNRDTDPATGVGPPRDDPTGNAYRAALWNYNLVLNDATRGVHNPTFTKSLIMEAIAAVEALPAP